MTPSELIYQFGRPIAYYPGLVPYLGSVNAVILFCQFFYWTGKETSEFGIFKTTEEIESETGLTYEEQLTARKKLKQTGVLKETNKRLEHRIYYQIDTDRLDGMLSQPIDNSPNGESPFRETGKPQLANEEKPKPPARDSLTGGQGIPHFDHTEITTETTSEKRTRKAAKSSAIDFSAFPMAVSPEIWDDYLKHRKAKRAPITQTVVNMLGKELNKAAAAGWSVDDALSEAMVAGWQGFKFEWLQNRSRTQNQYIPNAGMSRQEALEAHNARVADDFVNGGW
ncbi:DNA-binding protein [Yersinia rochesterensis]|uniref:DNA-binding protein n=1 Tax=Yersinia rochesterensis TaxID=1604335 RepID=UPI0011A83E76|nr:DNA-binding protein [Yersinia rochesterensis]